MLGSRLVGFTPAPTSPVLKLLRAHPGPARDRSRDAVAYSYGPGARSALFHRHPGLLLRRTRRAGTRVRGAHRSHPPVRAHPHVVRGVDSPIYTTGILARLSASSACRSQPRLTIGASTGADRVPSRTSRRYKWRSSATRRDGRAHHRSLFIRGLGADSIFSIRNSAPRALSRTPRPADIATVLTLARRNELVARNTSRRIWTTTARYSERFDRAAAEEQTQAMTGPLVHMRAAVKTRRQVQGRRGCLRSRDQQ